MTPHANQGATRRGVVHVPVQCIDCDWRGPRIRATSDAVGAQCPSCDEGTLEWVPARPGLPAVRQITPV